MERHKNNIHTEENGVADILPNADENDETDRESDNEDDSDFRTLTDLDIVTDFYNKIILGLD